MTHPPGAAEKYPAFNFGPQRRSISRHDRNDWKMKLERAWDAYNGNMPNPLKTMPGAPNDNVILSTASVIVDKSVSYLFGKSFTFNLDKEETRSPDETYLDGVWAFNQKDVLIHRLATNGGIFGEAFLKFVFAPGGKTRMLALDPRRVHVETAYDDYTDVNAYVIVWEQQDPESRTKNAKRVYLQRIERVPAQSFYDANGSPTSTSTKWRIIDQEGTQVPTQRFEEIAWQTIREEMWPWWFPPIVDTQSLPAPNDYWGVSDIEPNVIALCEAVDRATSNVNKILRIHAHPKTVVIGLEESQAQKISVNIDGMLQIPGDKTMVDIKNLEMQSDLSSSLNYITELRMALNELSRTPEVASGRVHDLAYLSAMAMQILYGPMMEKTRVKRMTYGAFIVEINRRLLAMAGRGDERYCTLVWPDTFPRDEQIEAQTSLVREQVGFSQDTEVARLGGDAAYERTRRKADEQEAVQEAGDLAKAEAAAQPKPAPQPSGQRTS